MVSTLKADNYDYIVGNQPIGNKLFRQFCEAYRKHYCHYNEFLDEVDTYETELEDNRVVAAQKIFTKYLSKPPDLPLTIKEPSSDISIVNGKTEDSDPLKTVISEDSNKENTKDLVTSPDTISTSKFIPILPEEMLEKVTRDINSKSRELFSECQDEVNKFLSEAPFKEFRMSMYFHRYLQWKYLEGQQVTYKTFRMYRVLGKSASVSYKHLLLHH